MSKVKMTKNKNSLMAVAVCVVLLIFLHFLNVLLPVESSIINFTKPVFSKFYNISSYLRVRYNEQTSKSDLIDSMKKLENQVGILTSENVKLKLLEEENNNLRQYLRFFAKNKSKNIMADIISRGGADSNKSGRIIIGKGAKDGLMLGLPVVTSEGVIIGKIINLKDYLAEVCLTTDSQCKLAAAIQNEDKTSGITEGDLGLTIKMNFIPQTKEIKAGDIVVTSGLEQNISRGLVIGSVMQVNRENNELWQSANIEPLIDPNDLMIVSVLLPN